MAANRIRRSRGDVYADWKGCRASGPIYQAQELADAEQRAARIHSANPDHGRSFIVLLNRQPKSFRSILRPILPFSAWPGALPAGIAARRNRDNSSVLRPVRADWPIQARPLPDFLHQYAGRRLF